MAYVFVLIQFNIYRAISLASRGELIRIAHDFLRESASDNFRALVTFALITSPFAAGSALVLGVPWLYNLQNQGKLTKWHLIAWGVTICVITPAIAVFTLVPRTADHDIDIFAWLIFAFCIPPGLAAGAIAGLVFWRIAVIQKKDPASDLTIAETPTAG
jgi:hypothetical protein